MSFHIGKRAVLRFIGGVSSVLTKVIQTVSAKGEAQQNELPRQLFLHDPLSAFFVVNPTMPDLTSQYIARPRRILDELARTFFTASRIAGFLIVVGIAFRVGDYAKNRWLWRDETELRLNTSGRPIFEFDRPFVSDQLAPPGFVVAARISSRIIGDSSYAIRFIPLLCALASLFVLKRLSERTVSKTAVPVAVALAALSDDLIYYAGEFKPYSGDVLIAMGCVVGLMDLSEKPLTFRRAVLAAVWGAAALWFSFPVVFVLAAGGVWLAGRVVADRRWSDLPGLAALGAAWGISFVSCYLLSRTLLGEGDFMWLWWDFAFLRLPPRSLGELSSLFWTFANVFTNPVGIVTPFGMIGSGLLALGLFLIGVGSFAKRRAWDVLTLLLVPIALTMVASALHRYPFHGRLLLFLVPSFILPVAEGVAAIGRRWGRWVMTGLIIVLLCTAANDAINRLERSRGRIYDSHGDQRNDLLDALEKRPTPERPKKTNSQPSSQRS